jgi:hypothetical protein
MIAEDPVLPWYNDLEVLPFCFCKAGEAHRLPEDACNEAGVPYIRPIIYIRAIDNPNSFKPLHAVKTGMHEYTCLICWETHKGNNQKYNNNNAFAHVKSKHLEEYPINCWSAQGAKELESKWIKALNEQKRNLKGPKQVSIQQAFSVSKNIPDQIKCWTKAVIIGKTIPISIQKNLGTREVIKFYNSGNMPRGLSDYGIKNQIVEEYSSRIAESKQRLGVDNEFPLVEDDDDPCKLKRIYGLGHDIWSNRNGESFTTFTLSKIDTSFRPWTVKKEKFLAPHNLDHTSENNLEVITEIMTELGISTNSLISATQDTTGYSINIFNEVPHVGQLLCCSHVNELVSMHSVEDDATLMMLSLPSGR